MTTMSPRAWAAFAAVSLIWGVPYLFVKVIMADGVSPVFATWARVVLGAAVLLAFALRPGVLVQIRGKVGWLAVFGFTEIVLPFTLIAYGEQHVSSSLASILIAAAPLFGVLLALRVDRSERVSAGRLAGLFIGLVGVAALVGIDFSGRSDELLGAAAIMVAAICYTVGPMVIKHKLADVDPTVSMGASLVLAALMLTPGAAVTVPAAMPSAAALAALLGLGVLSTAAGLVLYSVLVAEAGPSRALVVAYINPVVAVILGAILLGEHVGAGTAIGLVLVLVGSWLSTGGRLSLTRLRTSRRLPARSMS